MTVEELVILIKLGQPVYMYNFEYRTYWEYSFDPNRNEIVVSRFNGSVFVPKQYLSPSLQNEDTFICLSAYVQDEQVITEAEIAELINQ